VWPSRRSRISTGPAPAKSQRFKRPKDQRFVDALPTNNYGKVVKRELRDRLRAETADGGSR
jgi:acyl-coenzyme A synthetase/AMP-(fatty) acid ligase